MRNHDLNPKILFFFVCLCVKWVLCIRNDIVYRRGAKYPLTDKEKFPSTSKKHYESSSRQKHRVKKEHYGRQNSDGNPNLTSFTKVCSSFFHYIFKLFRIIFRLSIFASPVRSAIFRKLILAKFVLSFQRCPFFAPFLIS